MSSDSDSSDNDQLDLLGPSSSIQDHLNDTTGSSPLSSVSSDSDSEDELAQNLHPKPGVGPRTSASAHPTTKHTLKAPPAPPQQQQQSLLLNVKKKQVVYDSDSAQEEDYSELEDEIDEFDEPEEDNDSDNSFSGAKRGVAAFSSSGSLKASKGKGKSASGSKKREAGTKRPKEKGGHKTVPHEVVVIPMGDKSAGIDKMLGYRVATEDGAEDEVLVKYKNMSYIHCEWIPRSAVESEGRNGKQRLQKFLQKPLWESQWSEEEPFNPSFKVVDRIIDDGDQEGELYFLVKWNAQTYDMSTWEPASLVEELDDTKVKEFYARRDVNQAKFKSHQNDGIRPFAKEWSKMDESPVYKNDMQLRAYQLEGLNWLMFCWYHRQNSILADEMGLGKTVQSSVFLDYLYTRCNVKGPFLVIAPLSTIGNWERELNRWSDMNVVVYHGREAARNLIVETEFYYRDNNHAVVPNIYKFDVVLTTYEMAMSGISQLKPIKWRCCVLDEAHRLKNKTSKISELLKQYHMEHRVLLTGTPLQNSLDELWALLNFLEPTKFASERDFQRDFGNLTSATDVERLQGLLKPLMLRRLKEDVEKSIPIKEETIIEVELTTMQKKWYKSILERNFAWLKQGADKRSNMPNLINAMMELRKCCIHPFLLNGAEDAITQEFGADTPEKQFLALVQASGKMVLIDKLLRKLKQGGHKVLIFSQMTRCLDLIQDYLRGQQWGFERIDGSVRGDLRQAAIDRFSAPGCETFIFLLCTRAGGVGINLTAADTVIIFDSDWNPQNDLQAQSRVHRIGQKKNVLIYRLITRNTYEREMFDKASMKLGLDRAILQRMDAQSAYGGGAGGESESTKMSGMSKTEIENLLKKGAYAAFMDDSSSNDFCEEDIDQILSRRTQVIRHDNAQVSEKGSIFSKATFATSEETVDMNDPEFWDKVAKKAELNIVEVSETTDLIMDSMRVRKQVQRYGDQLMDEPGAGGDDPGDAYDGDVAEPGVPRQKRDGNTPRLWSQADRLRLERCLMTFGYARWDRFIEICKGRSVSDLKACSQIVIQFALTQNAVDVDCVEDMKTMLAQDGIPDITVADMSIPYNGATKRQIAEYRSSFLDAPKEQHDYFARKAKNLLQRLQMLYNIREKMRPVPGYKMPPILGAPLTPWWGDDEDRDLMLGTLKWGYGKYAAIASDPEYCFSQRLSQLALEKPLLLLSEPVEGSAAGNGGTLSTTPSAEVLNSSAVNTPNMQGLEPASDGATSDVKHDGGDSSNAFADEEAEEQKLSSVRLDLLPSASDLGLRIRKVIASFLRNQILSAREEEKRKLLEERARAKQEKEDERLRLKERELTKRDRQEFYRTLSSYGAESDRNGTVVRDWTRFKEISQLKKAPDALEEYYHKLMALCREVINPTPGKPPLTAADMDFITIDKAKKLVKRVESMTKLREEIVDSPHLDASILALRNVGRSGLPEWWSTEHDKGYLIGIAKWGLNRADLYVEDDTLPFKAIYAQYLNSRADGPPILPGRIDERFWMKESIAMKRFYSLCDCVMDPSKKRGSGGSRARPAAAKFDAGDSDFDDMDEDLQVYNPKKSRSRAAANGGGGSSASAAAATAAFMASASALTSDAPYDELEQIRALTGEISQVVAGVKRKRSKKNRGSEDGEDDGLFEGEAKKKKKSKKKHSHEMVDLAPEDFAPLQLAPLQLAPLQLAHPPLLLAQPPMLPPLQLSQPPHFTPPEYMQGKPAPAVEVGLAAHNNAAAQDALLAGFMDLASQQEKKKKKKHKKSGHHDTDAAADLLALMGGMMQNGELSFGLDVGGPSSKKSKKKKSSKKHHGNDNQEAGFLSSPDMAVQPPADSTMADETGEFVL